MCSHKLIRLLVSCNVRYKKYWSTISVDPSGPYHLNGPNLVCVFRFVNVFVCVCVHHQSDGYVNVSLALPFKSQYSFEIVL